MDKSLLINGRNLTNIGVFRKYIESYIEKHSAINKDLMVMARQLQPGENGLFYLLDGSGRLEGYGLVEAHMLYQLDAGAYMFTPSEKTKVFFIAAAPINEKVESYGPFVMTNQTEIMEAMRDYQQGKMGFLVERDLP